MSETRTRLEVHGSIAELVLNRPDKLNAIDERMLLAIEDAVSQAEDNAAARVLIVRGEGRAFSAGADLAEAEHRLNDPDELSSHADLWRRVLGRLSTCPIPTISAVHGTAVAGGFELTLACDLVVLADDAHYGDGHTLWGLVPSGGASQRLPRLVGPRLASWMLFSGEPIAPDQAKAYGLVNEVVAADQVLATSRAMAQKLAERGPTAIAAMKQAMRDGLDAGGLPEGLEIEKTVLMEHMSGSEPAVGVTAFLTRTKPTFSRETPGGP